ncbi:MAG: sodium:solute symporter family protein [Candidatus Amoebophilus sp.]
MIDTIIFIVFLLLNLIIGILYRGKQQSFKEYAIGNKNFSTAALIATLVATQASGSMFLNGLEQTYTNGLYYVLASVIGSFLGLLITGYIIGPRLGNFLNCVSIADIMSSVYGKGVQLITAICTVLATIGYIAIQFKVISRILEALFNYQGPEVTVIAATIIIIYSAFGGIKSVTFTDVIQFITFGTLLPVLALAIWHHIPNINQVIHTLSENPNFNFKHVISWSPQFMGTLAFMFVLIVPGLPPEIFQRMAMARNTSQIKRAIAYAAVLWVLIQLFIVWIAVLLLSDKPDLTTNQVVGYMIKTYTYTGLKGFLGVGVIALSMSTADSALNSCAVLVANDILPPLKITKQASVKAAAIATFAIGFLAVLLTLSIQNILQIILLFSNFSLPILTIPMLLTIFGFRTSRRVIYIGMGAGFAMTAFLLLYFKDVNSFFPGMLANLTFLLGSHYLLKEKGGWIKQETEAGIEAITWKDRWTQLKSFNLPAYLEKNLPEQEYYYPLLAFYSLIATYVSLYHLPHVIEQEYLMLYRTIQYSVLVITTSLLGFQIWPAPLKNKRLLAWVWPLLIFYTLFFIGGMIVIMSGFQSSQILIFMLSLVMIALFTYLPLALTLAIAGIIVAAGVFKWVTGQDISPNQAIPISFHFSHGLLLFSSLLIALFRFKQSKETLQKKNAYLMTLNNQSKEEMQEVLSYREEILKDLTKEDTLLFDETMAAYMRQAIYRMTDYMRLDVKRISMEELISEVRETIKLTDFPQMPDLLIQNKSKEPTIEVDRERIKQMLANSITYLYQSSDATRTITIVLEDAKLGYSVAHMQNYARESNALRIVLTIEKALPKLQSIYNLNHNSIVDQVARDGNRRMLLQNARIVDAHYGYAELDSHITHLYVIPVNLREVRGKVMEIIREPAVADPAELNHPLSIKVEQELKNKLTAKGIDCKPISKALNVIKRYHAGVKRKSGEPFFTHPIAAALILLEYCEDPDAVIAALLHDTVEDTGLSLIQIKIMFGETVAFLVQKVTNLEENRKRLMLEDHENIARLINYEDKRAAYVKLADRMHNMRTISGHSSLAKQKHIASETLNFFVPLAKNLELTTVSQELEKLSLEVLKKK